MGDRGLMISEDANENENVNFNKMISCKSGQLEICLLSFFLSFFLYYNSDMAKVRPSNLFLRPLDLFCYLEKQII